MTLNLPYQCAIENAAELTQEDFVKKYFIPQKPVLLKGLANLQPAGGKWTINWFKDTMGDLQISVFDNNEKKHIHSTTVSPDFEMAFGQFLDIISKPEPSSIRMFRYNLYKQKPELRQDFSCPSFINRGVFKNMGFMFLGGKNTDVRLHYDVDYSNVLLTHFYGTKRVVLYPPDQSKYLYQVPFNTHSLADLKSAEDAKFPGIALAKGYDILQEAGDGIFMPSGYWHYMTYLEGGISVAFRKVANTPGRMWQGFKFVSFILPFDKLMGQLFNQKWNNYKTRLCFERVNRAIKNSD